MLRSECLASLIINIRYDRATVMLREIFNDCGADAGGASCDEVNLPVKIDIHTLSRTSSDPVYTQALINRLLNGADLRSDARG